MQRRCPPVSLPCVRRGAGEGVNVNPGGAGGEGEPHPSMRRAASALNFASSSATKSRPSAFNPGTLISEALSDGNVLVAVVTTGRDSEGHVEDEILLALGRSLK